MIDEAAQVDLNTAGLEALTTLPGVGPALAERLMQARPFTSLDDLGRVNGFSRAVIERLQPRVTLSPVESSSLPTEVEQEPVDSGIIDESEASLAEVPGEEKPPQVEAEAPQTPKPAPAPKARPQPASRMQAFWLAFAALVFATFLGATLSLGILALVNGGLSYARPYQVYELDRQIDSAIAQTEILSQDMDTLRARLDNLEGLSGRVGAVEKNMDGLRDDMDTALSSMDALSAQLENLDGEIAEMRVRTQRFQGFLEGLRELMGGLFSP